MANDRCNSVRSCSTVLEILPIEIHKNQDLVETDSRS